MNPLLVDEDYPCATCDCPNCADCEFNAENQPPAADDGQPDEAQEWHDFDADC